MARRRSAQPAALERAARKFEAWRRTRTRRTIPEPLWTLAAELAVEYGAHRCARRLRLNYDQLKKRLGSPPAPRGVAERAAFVEVVPGRAQSDFRLELEDVRGLKLRLELCGASARELAELARSLWVARR